MIHAMYTRKDWASRNLEHMIDTAGVAVSLSPRYGHRCTRIIPSIVWYNEITKIPSWRRRRWPHHNVMMSLLRNGVPHGLGHGCERGECLYGVRNVCDCSSATKCRWCRGRAGQYLRHDEETLGRDGIRVLATVCQSVREVEVRCGMMVGIGMQ